MRYFLSFQVGLRGIPMGIGDTGSTAVRRSRPIRDDGVSPRRISARSTETLSR